MNLARSGNYKKQSNYSTSILSCFIAAMIVASCERDEMKTVTPTYPEWKELDRYGENTSTPSSLNTGKALDKHDISTYIGQITSAEAFDGDNEYSLRFYFQTDKMLLRIPFYIEDTPTHRNFIESSIKTNQAIKLTNIYNGNKRIVAHLEHMNSPKS